MSSVIKVVLPPGFVLLWKSARSFRPIANFEGKIRLIVTFN